jgi:DNA polymerase III subunit delta
MKFYSSFPFIEHISASYPDHLAPMMFISHEEDSERAYIADEVKIFFDECSIKSFFISRGEEKALLEEVLGYDLFAEKTLVVVHDVEQWDAKQLETFANHVKAAALSGGMWVLLLSKSSKGHSRFYTQFENECACLDLSQEKPWDRDKRVLAWCMKEPTKYGKKYSSMVANAIVSRSKGDFSFIQSEVKRLCSAIGSRETITADDLGRLGSHLPSALSWDFAKKLVYEESMGASQVLSRSEVDRQLMTQVRYFLHIGLSLTTSDAHSDVQKAIQRFSDKKKRYFKEKATQRGKAYFLTGLRRLAQIEAQVRKGGNEKELLETFCIHLEKEKHHG